MVKILSVDDELDLELLLTQYFRRKIRKGEYEFYFAHNGIEALQTMLEHPDIDIVLSDINMPEIEMNNIRTAMNNGAFDFATKPIDLDDLQLTIDKAVAEIEFIKQTQREHGQLVDIKSDLALAAEIQMAILPKPDSAKQFAPAIDLHATMKPAKDVGGDFYDYFRIDDTHLGFCIADVSGKGVPAAIFMAVSHTLLNMFVTLFYGIIDTMSGEVQYVNAGHNPPYVLKADGTVTAMPVSKNVCLGVIEDYPYKSDILKLDKGDCLVTFTDGVTEACSPSEELYGEQRLEALLQTLGGSDTKTIVESINNAVHQHADGAEQSDDITILCVKRA